VGGGGAEGCGQPVPVSPGAGMPATWAGAVEWWGVQVSRPPKLTGSEIGIAPSRVAVAN
jgi:hypothetical protein